jgi:hypothetical protein
MSPFLCLTACSVLRTAERIFLKFIVCQFYGNVWSLFFITITSHQELDALQRAWDFVCPFWHAHNICNPDLRMRVTRLSSYGSKIGCCLIQITCVKNSNFLLQAVLCSIRIPATELSLEYYTLHIDCSTVAMICRVV